jgi:hypothetical protein
VGRKKDIEVPQDQIIFAQGDSADRSLLNAVLQERLQIDKGESQN